MATTTNTWDTNCYALTTADQGKRVTLRLDKDRTYVGTLAKVHPCGPRYRYRMVDMVLDDGTPVGLIAGKTSKVAYL